MYTKRFSSLILIILAFAVCGDVSYCNDNARSEKVSRLVNRITDGSEQLPQGNVTRTYLGASRSPGVQIGNTIYDKQRLHRSEPTSIKGDTKSLEDLRKQFEQLSSRHDLKMVNAMDGECEEVES